MSTTIIDAEELTREFVVYDGGGLRRTRRVVRAVDGLTLRVEPGEAVGYIGANGSGKSTTIKMVSGSIDAFINKDLTLARDIIEMDDVIDDLFDVVKYELIECIRMDASTGEQAVDLLMIAKYFERIGDHAENIAEWVEYSITGMHKGEYL